MAAATKKLATLVGINYRNTPGGNELHGCINDVRAMREVLINRFGFEPKNISLLTDTADSPVQPTAGNIRLTLQNMVNQAEPGDLLFFHFSGHGTQIPCHLLCQKDDAIVGCDLNLVTDLDFRQLVEKIPTGATLTIATDCCLSGGLYQEKEQIGPDISFGDDVAKKPPKPNGKAKYIPFHDLLYHLATISGLDSPEIGHHLWAIFNTDASGKFWPSMTGKLITRPSAARQDAGILLSGCQANELAFDLSPLNGDTTQACGAFSNAMQTVLAATPGKISNGELVLRIRYLMEKRNQDQHPCLHCSDHNVRTPFLSQPDPHRCVSKL